MVDGIAKKNGFTFHACYKNHGVWTPIFLGSPYLFHGLPSIRHIALEGVRDSVVWLKEKGYEPREAFGFKPVEPFVMAHNGYAHAKIHFNDPDGNSLELICKLNNPMNITKRMYLSEWEQLNKNS